MLPSPIVKRKSGQRELSQRGKNRKHTKTKGEARQLQKLFQSDRDRELEKGTHRTDWLTDRRIDGQKDRQLSLEKLSERLPRAARERARVAGVAETY